MAEQGAKLATGWLELVVSTDGAQKSILDGVAPGADAAGKSAGGLFGGAFTKVLAAGAIAGAVVVGFQKLYAVGAIFDTVADTIRIGTGATGEALDSLTESARNVGTTVPTSFEAAGSVVADLNTRLGLTGGTLETVASQYLEAGRILEQEVDIQGTTAAFSAFGIEGEAVTGAMDNLFRVSQATGVGMNELSAAARAQAPAMQLLGFSYEDTISMVGSLDKAGLNSTAVMASMSKGLVTLAKDGEEPQAAFQRVTGEIESLLVSGDKAAAIDLAAGIFGTRGATQFIGAVESGTVAFDDLMAATGATGDTILGVAGETRDFAESWVLVKNRGLDMIAPAAEGLFSILSIGMGKLADLMGVLPAMAAGVKSLFVDGNFTAGFREAFNVEEDSPIVGFLLTLRDGFITLWAALGPTISGLLPQLVALWSAFSPLSLILAAIGPQLPALVESFVGLAVSLGGSLSDALTLILPAITDLAGVLVGVLGGVLATLIPVVLNLVSVLGPVLGVVIAAMVPIIGLLAGIVVQLVAAFVPLLPSIFGLIPLIANLVAALLPPLVSLFAALLPPILGLVSVLIAVLVPILQVVITVLAAVIGWVAGLLTWVVQLVTGSGEAGAQLGAVWAGILEMFSTFFSNTVGMIVDFVSNTIGMFADFGAKVASTVSSLWATVTGFFSAFFAAALGLVLGFVSGVVSRFVSFGSSVVSTFSSMWSNVSGAVSSGISTVVGFISDLPGKAIAALGSLGSTLLGSGRALIQGFIDGISGMLGKVGDAVGGVMDFVGGFFPNSPADRGAFSGSGWTKLKQSGLAIGEQFGLGLTESEPDFNAKLEALAMAPSLSAARIGASVYSPGSSRSSNRDGDTYTFTGRMGFSPDEVAETFTKKKRRANARSGVGRVGVA